MNELVKTLPLMCLVLLIPVVPFLFWGAQLEQWLVGLRDSPPGAWATFGLMVLLLATDIFLPIPSSMLSTFSGWQLGWLLGAVATWLGMNLGAILGFALARRFGPGFASWFSKTRDLEKVRGLTAEYGALVLVMTRAIPVFAEASVLIAGIHQMAWRSFLTAVVLSNLGIAVAYSAFGDFAEQHEWLPLALSVSVAIPVLLAFVAGRFFNAASIKAAQEEAGHH